MESKEFENSEELLHQQTQKQEDDNNNNNNINEKQKDDDGVEDDDDDDDDDGPPPGYQTILSVPHPQLPDVEPISEPVPQPKPDPEPEPTQIHTLTPPTTTVSKPPLKTQPSASSEIAQMVCGSCRRLLRYPPRARRVACSCCQTVNLVLQAHEVGQVKCGGCKVLLMYPYGGSQVRCSSCNFVTEIGAHNHRPPWSVQQGQKIS